MTNYQLYARVLCLWFMDNHPSMDWHNQCSMEAIVQCSMEAIVRDVIYPDRALVWC